MTIRQQFPLPEYGPSSNNSVDDDEVVSPSDGYFGDGASQVPNEVFVSNSEQVQKAQEAASERSGSSSQGPYTPQTSNLTPATSRRDSGSTHSGYVPRYRDSNQPDLLEADDAPPQYSETLATDWSQASSVAANETQYRDHPAPDRNGQSVRDVSTPSIENALPQRLHSPSLPRPIPGQAQPKKFGFIAMPTYHRKQQGWCGKNRNRGSDKRNKCKLVIWKILLIIMVIWAACHLIAWAAHRGWHSHRQPPSHPPNNRPPPFSTRPSQNQPSPPPGIIPGRPPGTNRKWIQHETSNSIKGTYHLYDLVDLSTSSGSVQVTIIPEPAANDRPSDDPAELRIFTNSGSVRINMDIGLRDIPPRTFKISISTSSGSIQGSVLLGGPNGHGITDLSTKSGSITVSVQPLGNPSNSTMTNEFSTQTNSGSQTIDVKSPLFPFSSDKLTGVVAAHTSHGSGSFRITYPPEWEGIVHAKSHGSGSVKANGRGLEYGLKGSREVYAWRGRGDEKTLKTVSIVGKGSGSIGFNC